jgi:hypothetical protein
LVIFSSNANSSPQVRREIERAVSKEKIIIPFRIEDVLPSDALEFALSNTHWLDAITPPMERRLNELCGVVSRLIGISGDKILDDSPPPQLPNRKLLIWSCSALGLALCLGIGVWVSSQMHKATKPFTSVGTAPNQIPDPSVNPQPEPAVASPIKKSPMIQGARSEKVPTITHTTESASLPPALAATSRTPDDPSSHGLLCPKMKGTLYICEDYTSHVTQALVCVNSNLSQNLPSDFTTDGHNVSCGHFDDQDHIMSLSICNSSPYACGYHSGSGGQVATVSRYGKSYNLNGVHGNFQYFADFTATDSTIALESAISSWLDSKPADQGKGFVTEMLDGKRDGSDAYEPSTPKQH